MNEERNWLIEYRWNGDIYAITMWARTQNEAKQKLIVAGTHGIVQGDVQSVIPATLGAGLLTKLIFRRRQ